MIQTKVIVKTEDGYQSLDLLKCKDPYTLYAACHPWGTPVGLYVTEEGAETTCRILDNTQILVNWREQNEKLGFHPGKDHCFVQPLAMPTLSSLFLIYGEVLKEYQMHLLLLSEEGGRGVPDTLLEWAKEHRPSWFEKSEITHHEDCVSHEDDDFCDCDFQDRLQKEQEDKDG